MVRFFTERKTKATRTGVARRFPTFAHRSKNGGADSPRAKILRGIRGVFFCERKKNHALEKNANAGMVGSMRPRSRNAERISGEWSSDEENDAVVVAER